MTLDEEIEEADREVVLNALRMCRQAFNDYLTMAETEAVCRNEFLASRAAAETAINVILRKRRL